MAPPLDPYYAWLGIPPDEQPPDLYRLLGLTRFESNPDVIENAADRHMMHLRSVQIGAHGAEAQRLLNEVAAARVTLLDPPRRLAYDEQLHRKLAPPQIAAPAPIAAPAEQLPG